MVKLEPQKELQIKDAESLTEDFKVIEIKEETKKKQNCVFFKSIKPAGEFY